MINRERCSLNSLVIVSSLLITLIPGLLSVKLRGVTYKSHPFVIRDGNQYRGYAIDCLIAMKNKTDFDYYLHESNGFGFIDPKNSNHSGLLGELYTNNADFGVSGIVVTEELKQYVDFTDPILNYSISALIATENVGHIRTFQHLADQTRIAYGSLKNSSAMSLFGATNDFVLKRMYAVMNSTGVSVDSLPEALHKVKTSRWAFIGDSYVVDELARSACGLSVIEDRRPYFERQIALALPPGSKYLSLFNKYIKQLVMKNIIENIYSDYFGMIECGRSSSSLSSPIISSFTALLLYFCIFRLFTCVLIYR